MELKTTNQMKNRFYDKLLISNKFRPTQYYERYTLQVKIKMEAQVKNCVPGRTNNG